MDPAIIGSKVKKVSLLVNFKGYEHQFYLDLIRLGKGEGIEFEPMGALHARLTDEELEQVHGSGSLPGDTVYDGSFLASLRDGQQVYTNLEVCNLPIIQAAWVTHWSGDPMSPDPRHITTYQLTKRHGLSDALALVKALLHGRELKAPGPILIESVKHRFIDIFENLQADISTIRALSGRAFEEFVAELLIRHGLKVDLTPPQKDRGIDMFAYEPNSLGSHVFAIECKNPRVGNPIGVDVVRNLVGAAELSTMTFNACALFTTSTITSDAKKLALERPHFIYLHDGTSVEALLKSAQQIRT